MPALKFQWKSISYKWCDNLQELFTIIIIIIIIIIRNLKQSEKKDKYLDLAREFKKLWHMKMTIVPIVIGALRTVNEGLLKGQEDLEVGGRVETILKDAVIWKMTVLL